MLLRDFKQDHADFVALDSSDEEENEDVPSECLESESPTILYVFFL